MMSSVVTPPVESTPDPVARLRSLVLRNGRAWRRLRWLEVLGLLVAPPLAVLWIAVALDAWLHLPMLGRFAAGLAFLAALVLPIVWLRRQGLRGPLGEDEIALAIEQRTAGGIGNRLINALQLSRDQRHAALAEAVVQENVRQLERVDLPQAARARRALVQVGLAIGLVAVGVLFGWLMPAEFSRSAARVLLPFADVRPVYRTELDVEPGHVEAVGDVTISIRVRGRRPEELILYRTVQGHRTSEALPLEADQDEVNTVIRGVHENQTYAVGGGDYLSPTYRIDVPPLARLTGVRATLHLPDYTHRPVETLERAGGDLEALQGTRAELQFSFDRAVDQATLLLETAQGDQPIPLTSAAANDWRGAIVFDGVLGYSIETRQGERPAQRHGPYSLRSIADQPPKASLADIETSGEVAVESVLSLTLSATDDYGVAKVGLFTRRGDTRAGAVDGGWQPVQVWDAKLAAEWRQTHELAVAALGVAEGDAVEVSVRAADADPLKKGAWSPGPVVRLLVGGEGAQLQRQYEQLIRSEADLRGLIAAQKKAAAQAEEWRRKLEAGSGLRWDDPKNVEALRLACREQAAAAEATRREAGAVARAMLTETGAVRQGLGMLADTEMVRAVRILESVRERETPQAQRAALADARATFDRTGRSLGEMLEQHVSFRHEWELAHMLPFAQMLADRQTRLRDLAAKQADANAPAGLAAESLSKRQHKMLELIRLVQPAFTGLAGRLEAAEPLMSQAFREGATTLAAPKLAEAIKQASTALSQAAWAEARPEQEFVAQQLAEVAARLKKAQADAAAAALAALREKAKNDAEAQKALKKLQAGSKDKSVNLADNLKLNEIVHMSEQAQNGAGDGSPGKVNDYLFTEEMKSKLQTPDSGKRQEFDILKLAEKPGSTPSFPNQSDREANMVTPHVQETMEDLVGKLLEEADEMAEKYESLNLNAAFNINEPGEISKQGGDINSTAAAAATGNQKPPTTNVGGVSRAGRRGARAHGMVVGEETVNRRGRDEVQEGQEITAIQPGTIKEKPSEDMQKDTSTGFGGKKVETDLPTTFSLADAGKWTEEMGKHMDKPKDKFSIVERQDGRLDPKMAELLRDLNSEQEQVLERVKAIRKELKNLYLPTDHLDEIAAKLQANLEALKERPDPELFRQQSRLLDSLRQTVRVFQPPQSGFTPSLPRDQAVKGRVVDEPASEPWPGYEEATKRYYQRLATR